MGTTPNAAAQLAWRARARLRTCLRRRAFDAIVLQTLDCERALGCSSSPRTRARCRPTRTSGWPATSRPARAARATARSSPRSARPTARGSRRAPPYRCSRSRCCSGRARSWARRGVPARAGRPTLRSRPAPSREPAAAAARWPLRCRRRWSSRRWGSAPGLLRRRITRQPPTALRSPARRRSWPRLVPVRAPKLSSAPVFKVAAKAPARRPAVTSAPPPSPSPVPSAPVTVPAAAAPTPEPPPVPAPEPPAPAPPAQPSDPAPAAVEEQPLKPTVAEQPPTPAAEPPHLLPEPRAPIVPAARPVLDVVRQPSPPAIELPVPPPARPPAVRPPSIPPKLLPHPAVPVPPGLSDRKLPEITDSVSWAPGRSARAALVVRLTFPAVSTRSAGG